ncbi:MAG: SusD/RagB family nutrient-binding outer membrane lipoprotein [Pedobacter sp.]|nr:MAG: SusD/RagB family nutrient-binding outer membrane lipoprotein [Pedobacter sp.]
MKKKFIYTLSGILIFGAVGCKKFDDFGGTNVDPTAITEANPGALLTNSLAGLGGQAFSTIPGYYSQYFSQSQYPDAMNYSLQQLAFTGVYSGTLNNLQTIINLKVSNNMTQVATILQQYYFWRVTDQWGDVPYSEALKGIEFNTPKYDTQEEIYKGMIAALTTAANSFDGSAITGDIVFKGDVASWKRTANSMRILMAVQLSKRYPGANDYAATQVKAALADPGGVITTNEQNFKVVYPGGPFRNTIRNGYDGRKDYGESKTMTDLMAELNDPRQNAFGGSSEQPGVNTTSNVGIPYGFDRTTTENFTNNNVTWARVLRGDLRQDTSPMYIITAAQVYLARAEAANLGWTSENLTTMYNTGITLSFQQWGAGTPSAAYLAGVALGPAGAGNNKNIAIQRYIASYPDGITGWNIWRKSGYPVLTPAAAATNSSKQIPRRYAYATSEQTSNKVNNDAAIARLPGGRDTQDARIWWDQ